MNLSMIALNEYSCSLLFTWLIMPLLGLLSGWVMTLITCRLPALVEQEETGVRCIQTPFILPGSQCCFCHHPLTWPDCLPLFSYLRLGGKCRYCHERISWRYPVQEAGCLLFAVFCGLFQGDNLSLALALYTFGWFAFALAEIDSRTFLLPDALTLPLLWLGLIFNATTNMTDLVDAIWGAVLGYTLLWSLFWAMFFATKKKGMGYGDFKLLAATGAWFGWQCLPAVLFVASTSGLLYALAGYLLFRKKSAVLPFGPFLALGGTVYFIDFLTH